MYNVLLIFIIWLLGGAAMAQPDMPALRHFSHVIPDSLHQKRYLKNWKLKGPVKQVVVKDFWSYHNLVFRSFTPESSWDTLTPNWLETQDLRYKEKPVRHDTIKFLPSGKLDYMYYGDPNSQNRNQLGQNFKVDFNALGYPTSIISRNGDTTNFTYDALNRIVLKEETLGATGESQRHVWEYEDGITKVSFFDNESTVYPTNITTYHYYPNGLLKTKIYWVDFTHRPTKKENTLPPYGHYAVIEHYAYDQNGRLSEFKSFDEEVYPPMRPGDADSIAWYGDTATITYSYNTKGQLIESKYRVANQEQPIDTSAYQPLGAWDVLYEYNDHGWATKSTQLETEPGPDFLKTSTDKYVYDSDPYGNPTKIIHKQIGHDGEGVDKVSLYSIQFIEYEYYK